MRLKHLLRRTPRQEWLTTTAAHAYQPGDFIAMSTDWRPYVVIDATPATLQIERMSLHRALWTRVAIKIRRKRWVPFDGVTRIVERR